VTSEAEVAENRFHVCMSIQPVLPAGLKQNTQHGFFRGLVLIASLAWPQRSTGVGMQLPKLHAGVEPWRFKQYREEGVFIPGGCPHQVRNLMSCTKVRKLHREDQSCTIVACKPLQRLSLCHLAASALLALLFLLLGDKG